MDNSSQDHGDHVWSLAKDWLHLRPPSPFSSFGYAVDLEDKLLKVPYSHDLIEKDFWYLSSACPNTVEQGLSSPFDGDILSGRRDDMPFERIIGLTAHKPGNSNQGNHLSSGNGDEKHKNESYDVMIENFPVTSQEELLHQELDSGNSSARSMMVEMAEESWQDGFDRGNQADHLYFGFTYPSYKKSSNNNHREIFETDDKEPCNQLRVTIQPFVSSSEEIPSFAVDTKGLLDSNLPTGSVSFTSSCSTACLGSESKSRNLPVPNCQLSNMHDLKEDFCLSSSDSLARSMDNEGNSMLPEMNGIGTKLQNPSMSDSYVNYAPQKAESVSGSERKKESRTFNSFSRVGSNGFNIRGTVDDVSIPVQYDFLPTDNSFFPLGIGDQLLPKSKLPSLSLHEGMGFVFTHQVTEGAVRCENKGLHEESDCLQCTSSGTSCDKFCQCGCADAWPPRIVDEKFRKDSNTVDEYAICCGLDRSRKMYALEQLKEADDKLAGRKDIANQSSQEFKHSLESVEPRKFRSYFADSVIDCHTLVENIQNSSLLLIASHSSESDRLVEADVQALLSVVANLSEYLIDRAAISASCIQAAIQPVKDHSGSNSRICEKVFKWTKENNDEDYGMQASKLSDTSYTSRGIHFVEGGTCSTQILAKCQGTDSKKMGNFSVYEKDKYLERRLSESQKQVEKSKEDFGFELQERDTAIHFYNNRLREYKAALPTVRSEMEHITELQLLKQNKFRTDAHLFDVKGGKTSEKRDGMMLKNSLEIDLKSRENVTDQAERTEERDPEDPDMNTNLISAMGTISPVNAEGSFWEPVAALHSHLESLGKASEIRGITGSDCSVVVDLSPKDVADKAVKLLSCAMDCKNAEIKKNQISLINDTPQAHYEDSLWQQAATSMIWERSPQESDTMRNMKFCNHDAVGVSPEIETREEIIRRFKLLEECNHLHMREKNSEKQLGKAIIDEPSICENSLVCENAVGNSYTKSSESNQEDNQSRQDEGAYLNLETYLLSSDRSLRKGETSEVRDETNCKFFPEVDWELKGNVDQTTTLVSCGKLCESHGTKTNLNYPMNITPQTDNKHSIWDRAAILFSREERLGDPYISRNMNAVDNDTQDVIAKIHSVHNEEILSRFRSLQECNKSGLMARASGVQSDEATINVSGSCNYAFHSEESEVDSSYSESYESLQGEDDYWKWATFLTPQEKKLRECEFSDIGDETNSTCSIEVDLNLEQVRDRASILSREKVCDNPKTNTYLNCLVNTIPDAHYESSIWDRAAILFSREESCGDSERCRDMITCNHDAIEREEILHRFKVLQECSDQSDTTQRDFGEQISKAIIDEPGLCNYFHKENACEKSNSESHKSIQEHNQTFHGEKLANQSVYPDSNEVQACYAVLYHSEASGDRIEDHQPIVASRSFEKQTSSPHESEPESNCDNPKSPYFTRQSPHSHLELKIPLAFRMEHLVLPSTESSFEENKLIRDASVNYQSKPSSLIQTSDVAVGCQSKYFYNKMKLDSSKSHSNHGELINTNTMEYSARERKRDNVFSRDHSSQTLSPTSSSILKLDSDTSNIVTGNKNQNCSNPSKGSTDAESLNQEKLNCSLQYQHDIGQHNFYNELESSSTESESSWEYVEKEEDITFQ